MARATNDPLFKQIDQERAINAHTRDQEIKKAMNRVIRYAVYIAPISGLVLYLAIVIHNWYIGDWDAITLLAQNVVGVVVGFVLAKLKES